MADPAFRPSQLPAPSPAPARAGLLARYDTQALRPPAASPGGSAALAVRCAAAQPAWQALLDWCFEGTGTGACPWFAPRATPDLATPFAAALLGGPDRAALDAFATALCLHLDGSVALAGLPGQAARLAYRLQVKAQDLCWWRVRRRADPWDCGRGGWDAAAVAQLARFAPRRATLIVVREAMQDGKPDERTAALASAIAQLAARRTPWRHPVRLLLLDEGERGTADRDASRQWLQDASAPGTVSVFEGPGPQLITSPPSMLID